MSEMKKSATAPLSPAMQAWVDKQNADKKASEESTQKASEQLTAINEKAQEAAVVEAKISAEEFHKLREDNEKTIREYEERMVGERKQLHDAEQQRKQQEQQAQGPKFLPPENQLADRYGEGFGEAKKAELAPRNDALANDAHRGSFADNQIRAQAESRVEFEKAEGKVLVTCAETPSDVKPMNPQLDEQREKAQSDGMSM